MLEPAETSFFSRPSAGLDPRLFRSGKVIPKVRNSILQILFNHVNSRFTGSESWMHVWLAGSGVSYQWAAHREPADLDCLVGVDFIGFRQSNEDYARFSNKEISQMFNEGFREKIYPETANFMGVFELTFYVNIQPNILDLKPYAAYSLTDDAWVVAPTTEEIVVDPSWEQKTQRDKDMAIEILKRYGASMSKLEQSSNESARVNASRERENALTQAVGLYEDIHSGRKHAFSESGKGYGDWFNYRWQSGKRSGIVQGLQKLKELKESDFKTFSEKTYGSELADANVLIRRAASQRINRS